MWAMEQADNVTLQLLGFVKFRYRPDLIYLSKTMFISYLQVVYANKICIKELFEL